MSSELVAQIRAAFADEVATQPPMSLRGGNDVDSYDLPNPFDPQVDALDDAYIAKYGYWALPHLDPESWRHYLGPLLEYALARRSDPGDLVVQGLIWGLWPPDRDPPRFASLSEVQRAVVVEFLELMALEPSSSYQEDATRAIDDWWGRSAEDYPSS